MAGVIVGIFICVFYGLSSSSLSFFMKIVISTYNYNHPYVVLFLQFTINIIIALLMYFFLKPNKVFNAPNFSVQNLKDCFLVTLVFLVNVLVGLFGLKRLSIPMFLAVRRFCTLFIYFSDVFILKKEGNTL